MKILVDEMPSRPMDCPYAEMEGNMEYQWWYCNYGECGCKNTKDCLFFMSFEDYKNRTYERTRYTPIMDQRYKSMRDKKQEKSLLKVV